MSQFSSSSPIQPLSIGNVVTAGVRLYRFHFKNYFRLALFAHLWVLVPIYGWAKYFAISGLISRLAFGELVNQPESIKNARERIDPLKWSFLRIAFQVGISLLLLYIGLAIVGGLFAGVVGFILGTIFGATGISIVLTIIPALGIIVFGFLWFYSHWVIAEVPLAIEENINGGRSVDRSWDLTKNSIWRILGVVLVAFVVTLPVIILSSYLPQILLRRYEPGSTTYTVIDLVSLLTSLVGGALSMPFWQAIKAVVYYDLRARREGLGLKLRDRDV